MSPTIVNTEAKIKATALMRKLVREKMSNVTQATNLVATELSEFPGALIERKTSSAEILIGSTALPCHPHNGCGDGRMCANFRSTDQILVVGKPESCRAKSEFSK